MPEMGCYYGCTCWMVLMAAATLCSALVPEISLKSADNDVISSDKWPTLNVSRIKTSYNITAPRIIDDNFDVVDPDPSSNPVIYTIPHSPKEHLERNGKNRQHHKWHHSTNKEKVWNNILPSSTVEPLVPAMCQLLTSTCPPYRLLERRKEYDIRWYPSLRWASAIVMTEDDRLLAFWEGLAKLEEYFNGHNDQQTTMNLTYPLLTQLKHGKHPGVLNQELRDITLSVPIPARNQINPPAPTSSDVLLDMVDSSTVFVHSFSARLWDLTDRALRHRANRLMTTLRNHGEAFHDRYYYLAAFSKPDNTANNVYEMWIHATRLRDPGRVKPVVKSRDPPLSKVTRRTRKRLCRGVECPSFDVLRVYKFGIQKRRYFDTVLAQAATSECEFNSLSVWRGFMPLHLYKHGNKIDETNERSLKSINSHWEVLEATRPIGIVHVADRVLPNQSVTSGIDQRHNNKTSSSIFCKHNLTVSLYLPQRLHSNPPTAGLGAPPVKINRVNDLIVFVQTVGGSILDPVRSTIEVKKFASRLKQLGLCYKPAEYYLVIYDFMVRFHGRQNEIWFLADRCPARVR